MTKFQTVLLAILAFAVAGALYVLVPTHVELAAGAAAIGTALLGWVRQHPEDAKAAQQNKQAGHATTASLVITYSIAFLFMLVSFAYSRQARADTPISKCWSTVCAEPQVSVSVVEYNLATRKIGAGVLPVGSVGYGIRDVNDYVAAGLYLSASIGSGQPNYLAPALLVRFMRAFTVGAQLRLGEDVTQVSLLAGGGFGL